jgi:hypothetical protein
MTPNFRIYTDADFRIYMERFVHIYMDVCTYRFDPPRSPRIQFASHIRVFVPMRGC